MGRTCDASIRCTDEKKKKKKPGGKREESVTQRT